MPARSPEEIERGIARIDERIAELRAFDTSTAAQGNPPALTALAADIDDTLTRAFGRGTVAYRRFQAAKSLRVPDQKGGFFSLRPMDEYYQEGIAMNIERSVELLQSAKRSLKEDLMDTNEAPAAAANPALARRVFVVHGHDEAAKQAVARFLEKIKFEPIILHEKISQGRTVIEKIEAHSDVSFAVVLLTPDDEGCAKGGVPEPRARQNVLLELGYFIGRLTRGRVLALKSGKLEIPSDFAGVVWEAMDSAGAWQRTLCKELEALGFDIDWKAAMS